MYADMLEAMIPHDMHNGGSTRHVRCVYVRGHMRRIRGGSLLHTQVVASDPRNRSSIDGTMHHAFSFTTMLHRAVNMVIPIQRLRDYKDPIGALSGSAGNSNR